MSKNAEILRTYISCHDTHICQKLSKSRGVMYLRCVSLTISDRGNVNIKQCLIEKYRFIPKPKGKFSCFFVAREIVILGLQTP